jgi:hypothetical protein
MRSKITLLDSHYLPGGKTSNQSQQMIFNPGDNQPCVSRIFVNCSYYKSRIVAPSAFEIAVISIFTSVPISLPLSQKEKYSNVK